MTSKICKVLLTLSAVLIFSSQCFALTAPESINNFAFKAAEIINNNSGNFFFSPFSIITAFSMAYAGASNDTAKEIEESLGLSPEIHKEFDKIFKDLGKTNSLSMANRVWLMDGLKLKQDYKNILMLDYSSTAKILDFKNKTEKSRKTINNWISRKTNGKIQNLLQKIEPDTQMILTNAIYFNSSWTSKFDKEKTETKKFHIDSVTSVDVQMMIKNSDFYYTESNDCKFVKIPYESGRFSMIAVLPPKDSEISLKNFDSESFWNIVESMKKYEVDLWLPKFKTEERYELKDLFQELGVKLAFSNFADFSNITDDEKLKIDNVIHQTFIDVDEEKTEAAAATAVVMMKATSAMPQRKPKAEFHADRPFLYFIVDNRTEIILFMGKQTFMK